MNHINPASVINNNVQILESELISGQVKLKQKNTTSTVNMTKNGDYQFIGRIERVSLPEFNLSGLKAKIDTGAYSVAIHANNMRLEDDELVFNLLDPEHPKFEGGEIRTYNFTTTKVRSSNGEIQVRFLIITQLVIGDRTFDIEATLADRKNMRYPILIGRKFLAENGFAVDVTSLYLHKKAKK